MCSSKTYVFHGQIRQVGYGISDGTSRYGSGLCTCECQVAMEAKQMGNKYRQILTSKSRFDLMHWNVSIGPEK
jgi:hypothetical protein